MFYILGKMWVWNLFSSRDELIYIYIYIYICVCVCVCVCLCVCVCVSVCERAYNKGTQRIINHHDEFLYTPISLDYNLALNLFNSAFYNIPEIL